VEIVRALTQDPKVLLLDEATGLLPPDATEHLLRDMRRMADEGLGVVLVTHRISEVAEVGDRVTIMRRGKVVSEFRAEDFPDEDELGRQIVGASVPTLPVLGAPRSATRLRVDGLSAAADHAGTSPTEVDLYVRAGEVLGIAGVDGNGQEQLLEAIAGLLPTQAGRVAVDENDVTALGYRARRRGGLVYVPGDRRQEGILPGLTVQENLRVGTGWSSQQASEAVAAAGVYPPDPHQRADRLSGGNQQKVVLARSLASQPAVLLLAYPLRGLDVNAAQAIRTMLIEQAARGTSVVIAWNDLDEIVAMCHRWVVMDRGRIVGEQERGSLDFGQLAKWLAGTDDASTGGRTAA
jgi:simple sugar transport system ATP-binding protein